MLFAPILDDRAAFAANQEAKFILNGRDGFVFKRLDAIEGFREQLGKASW